VSDHGWNNVVHVAGKKRMQVMMTVVSDAGEQFFISFGAVSGLMALAGHQQSIRPVKYPTWVFLKV